MSDTSNNRIIIETTESTFEEDVIERSMDDPVVVDFWATWCQPCRLLGPILETLAREANGAFVLVKAETEALPNVAAGFGVRSIPAVFAVREGRVVDSFLGLLPESAIRAWIERIMPTTAERLVSQARRQEATDLSEAERLYRSATEADAKLPAAKIGLARVLLSRGRHDESRARIEELEARGFLEPEAERLKAELALRSGAKEAGDLETLRAAVASQPADSSLRFKLAEALAAAGQYGDALELGLSLVEEGPRDLREPTRKLMIHVFQMLPGDSDLASEYRRKLSAALY